MPRRRKFNRRERIGAYLSAHGHCMICGEPLEQGWHADHIQPYSRGGETHPGNAQALCPGCNRKKGAKEMQQLKLRPFQEEFTSVALEKAYRNEKVVVANVHPGSGKTLAVLAAADQLFAAGFINRVVVFVPRINLAQQFEQDWAEYRSKLPWPPTLGALHHRVNEPPLIRGNEDGYITTYDSLCSAPTLHISEISNGRTLVIFDEAQQLGVDYDGKTTQSARWAQDCGDKAEMIFVMSGTPYRADGSKLILAKYGKPDPSGFIPLLVDVESTYQDGVRYEYLRSFEAILHDGKGVWQTLGDEPEELTLSEMVGGIHKIICQKGYWEPIVDKFVEKVREVQELIDPRLRGLITAYRQNHAKEIERYIRKKYPDLKVLLAISEDGEAAHQSLRKFREGRADILVTVHMAYVGYDYKPISVILTLTGWRTEGYLRQLFARGLRKMSDIEEDQTCFAVVPDDPKMQEFVEKLRRESKAGILSREDREQLGKEGEAVQQQLGWAINAWLTDIRGKGIDPTGDLTPEQYAQVEAIRKKHRVALSSTKLIAMMRELNPEIFSTQATHAPHPQGRPYLTMQEKEKAARRELNKLSTSLDYDFEVELGTTNKKLYGKFRKSVKGCTLSEIEERIAQVHRWREIGNYYD